MTTDWPVKLHQKRMEKHLVRDFAAPISGAHSDWFVSGSALAALALREAMSDVSEQYMFAAWLIGIEGIVWAWLQGKDTGLHSREQPSGPDNLASERRRIIALACVAGVWWADYDFAVPLSDWIARHGEAHGVELIA
jgi:hypothetical protein